MKDGAARIDLKDGELVSVSVGTGLDETYADLFKAACTEARSNPSRDAGVKVVLFGCFWLEALCNACLREFLESGFLPEPIQTSLWKALERVKTATKLDILASVQPPETTELLKRARALFELRNRLAHFKEEYTEVPGPHALDEELFDRLPEAALVGLLKPPALESSIGDIMRTKEWLDKVNCSVLEGQHLKGATGQPK